MGFIRVAHYPYPDKYKKIEMYDFANDLPICSRYPELDKRFPGSRFVYNYREVESWLISCENHQISRLTRQGPYYEWMEEYNVETYGAPYFDEKVWREAHRRHDEKVREYFANRPAEDLLIMDITKGQGWETLIPWVGFENMAFPWANSTKHMKQRAAI